MAGHPRPSGRRQRLAALAVDGPIAGKEEELLESLAFLRSRRSA